MAVILHKCRFITFHDTTSTSYLRRDCDINDNLYFKPDGRNLAAYLYFIKLKHPKSYNRILHSIQMAAPYIESFILEPGKINEREISLRWVDRDDPNGSFSVYQLSDGTLRFVALTVLLLQPTPTWPDNN